MTSAEEDEADELDRCGLRLPRRRHGDGGGELDRIAVDARRDRRKRDTRASELRGQLQRPAVARRQKLGLAGFASTPDRADCVDHVAREQPPGRRRLGVARVAAAEQPALGDDLRPAPTKTRGMSGSNWVTAPRSISAGASLPGRGGPYGRGDVIGSNASATASPAA